MTTRGFTFIELLVSVTLLLLLSGLMVAGYNGFNDTQTVAQATSTFKNNLRSVRTYATSGVKPAGCDTLIGYEVDFLTTASYTSTALCDVGGTTQKVGVLANYTLSPGVQFSMLPLTVTFYATGQGTTPDQTMTILGNKKSASVIISGSGVIGDTVPTPVP